jgi:serine/threonine protein phosphatase PrpC
MKFTTDTKRGRRGYQEDRFYAGLSGTGCVFAVIDGHGGNECAQTLVDSLPYQDFTSLENLFKTLNENTCHFESGAALSLVVIDKDFTTAKVAVLGDAPVLIRNANGSLSISPEHNVRSNHAERHAVIAKGGYYFNGYAYGTDSNFGLQMSRAFGDAALDKILNRTPEIYEVPLGPDSFVLLATDGVFDPSHESMMISARKPIVDLIDSGCSAADLVKRAIDIPTHDNATAILIRN